MLGFAAMAAPRAPSQSSICRPLRPSPLLCLRARVVRASLAPAFPSKTLNGRKSRNYLRRKLLKTLNPLPGESLGDPAQLIEELSHHHTPIETPERLSHLQDVVDEEVREIKELVFQTKLSESGLSNLESISARSVIGLSLGLAGLFLIQTAVAVWIFGFSSGNAEQLSSTAIIDRESETEAVQRKVMGFSSGVGVFTDGSEIENRIISIQEMAREARASERKKLVNETVKRNGDEVVTKAAAFGVIADIENEIDVRLRKLRKSATSRGPKYRNPLIVLSNLSTPESGIRKPSKSGNRSQKLKSKYENSTEIDSQSGLVTETKSARFDALNPQIPGPKTFDMSVNTGEYSTSTRKLRAKLEHNGKGSCSDVKKSVWWGELPYVLVILLHNRSDSEGPRGFFSLKMKAHPDAVSHISYTVAFEDRGDANNFCYIVESFFEDLGDVRADIVPLSIKEFEREVVSSSKKVVVLRKGQLKLYAGQPLTDVEEALCSLID